MRPPIDIIATASGGAAAGTGVVTFLNENQSTIAIVCTILTALTYLTTSIYSKYLQRLETTARIDAMNREVRLKAEPEKQ